MLNELDKELQRRDANFADMQMTVISTLNKTKSQIARPHEIRCLVYSFRKENEKYRIRVNEKSIKRFKKEIKEITRRSNEMNMEKKLMKLKQKITGWVNYNGIADIKGLAKNLNSWFRRKVRECVWKQ